MPEWLKRMFTLPKAKNSIDDVMGKYGADLYKQATRAAVVRALSKTVTMAEERVNGVAATILANVSDALGDDVPKPVSDLIHQTITDTLASVSGKPAAEVKHAVATAVLRALKL